MRKAVIAEETNGYGYGILSAITQNAILGVRDRVLRAYVYAQYEEQLKIGIADIISAVENGMDFETARKEAYTRIYQSANLTYNSETEIGTDFCYIDLPTVDCAMFSVARRLLMEAYSVRVQKIS